MATESNNWLVVRAGAMPAGFEYVGSILFVRSSRAPWRSQLRQVAFSAPDGHARPAGPAGPADDDALQQRGACAGRPGGPVAAVRGGAGGQPCAVGVVLVQGDVSGVGAGNEGDPFLAGQRGAGPFPA